MRRTRYLGPLHLPADTYKRLEEAGHAEERDALQQARWIIKQAMEAPSGDLTRERLPADVAGEK